VAARVMAEDTSMERKNERRIGIILGWSGEAIERIFE
jgi:hypothetical protein